MSEIIRVVATEDQLCNRFNIEDALRSPAAQEAGIALGGIYGTLGEAVNAFQGFAKGSPEDFPDAVILDGMLGFTSASELPQEFDTGENRPSIPGRKGFLGLFATPDTNPNLVPLDFMYGDLVQPGSDARNMLRLIETMRKRGLPAWRRLAAIGNSSSSMHPDGWGSIIKGTELAFDATLGKHGNIWQDPARVVQRIVSAVEIRRSQATTSS